MIDPRAELMAMGTGLGAVRWVQGPGGNVSVKTDGGELWVKASGARLRDVARDGAHAKVPLAEARAALEGDAAADARLFAHTPRPSLETYFHALDARVVAHTHALGVLLYACAEGAGPLPDGVTGAIPYARPGRGIALAMQEARVDEEEQAIVLGSHGIVVLAPTAAQAIARTERVDEGIRARFGALPPVEPIVASYTEIASRAFPGGFLRVLPDRASNATLATLATPASPPRYLFPDAVICASTLLVLDLASPLALAARSIAETRGRAHVLIDAKGRRALVAKSEAQLEQSTEVLAAHDWLEDALRAHGAAKYLPDEEPARLLDLPAEQYRIGLTESPR